jgi:hypothetical protein
MEAKGRRGRTRLSNGKVRRKAWLGYGDGVWSVEWESLDARNSGAQELQQGGKLRLGQGRVGRGCAAFKVRLVYASWPARD